MNENPINEMQKIRLDEKEFNFCKKLAEKILKYNSASEKERKETIDYISKECSKKKHSFSFNKIETEPEFEVYEFMFNNKPCYLAFQLDGKQPPNLIPSGIVNLDLNKND